MASNFLKLQLLSYLFDLALNHKSPHGNSNLPKKENLVTM